LKDGDARLTISLIEPYRQDRIAFDAVINTKEEADNVLVTSQIK